MSAIHNRFFYYTLLCCCFLFNAQHTNAQTTVFFENFENYGLDFNVENDGYALTYNESYSGNVSALIKEEGSNKFVKLHADTNGHAIMKLRKSITLVAQSTYKFEVLSQGNFKRRLQITNPSNGSIIAESSDFTPTEEEKTQWIKQSLEFTTPVGVTQVKLGIFHNWSGTLNLDDWKVTEATSDPTTYYLNANGDDSNDGTEASPWKTLAKISQTALIPGDRVFFNKGDRFDGHFVINGSGTESKPIVISSYGSGALPILTGEVGSENGGDHQEAIFVENHDNIQFEAIEIQNERMHNRSGVSEEDAYGIYILNSGTEILRNFTFRNVIFKNVYAPKPVLDPDDFNGLEVAAVRIESTKNKVIGEEKNIQNVLMENCHFSDLQRLGVHIKHLGANNGVGNDKINCNKDLIFRNNEFHNTGGTCILPIRTYNCLIENNIFDRPGDNSDPRMPNRGSSVWTWNCYNTVIQYNQCLHIRGYLDSHGIHIDHKNVNTFVQYNYMEDCEGGFVEILGGNVNAVYRFNVSVNDGWRENPNWVNSNHTLWINDKAGSDEIHHCEYSYIYNNTVYVDNPFTTAIDINAKHTFIYNNMFVYNNGSSMGGKQMRIVNNGTPLFMKNNLYEGSVVNSFINLDESPVYNNANFYDTDRGDKYGFQLLASSNAINAGVAQQGPPVIGAGTGVFKDIPVYPTEDFYGNPIDLSTGTPNIGACNAKNGEIVMSTDKLLPQNSIAITPNPASDFLSVSNLKKTTEIDIYNIYGQLVLQTQTDEIIDVSNLNTGVYLLKIVDGKSLQFIKE